MTGWRSASAVVGLLSLTLPLPRASGSEHSGAEISSAYRQSADDRGADHSGADQGIVDLLLSVSASFFPDASCVLELGKDTDAGATDIDANTTDPVAVPATLIRCTSAAGNRLNLRVQGNEGLDRMRTPLLRHDQADGNEPGFLVWLCRSEPRVDGESTTRFQAVDGTIDFAGVPAVQVAGAALHSHRAAFARIKGVAGPALETDKAGHARCPD